MKPHLVAWLLRIALSTAFLSAVADRFGLMGGPGAENIAWGAWQPFVDYTATLLFFMPAGLVSASAIMATVAEVVLGLWLLLWPWPAWTGPQKAGVRFGQ